MTQADGWNCQPTVNRITTMDHQRHIPQKVGRLASWRLPVPPSTHPRHTAHTVLQHQCGHILPDPGGMVVRRINFDGVAYGFCHLLQDMCFMCRVSAGLHFDVTVLPFNTAVYTRC